MSNKCGRCWNNATFTLDGKGALPKYFCDSHIPKGVKHLVRKLEVITQTPPDQLEVEAVAKKPSKKTKKVVVEEPEEVLEAVDEQDRENPDEAGAPSSVESDADPGAIS